MRHKFGLKPISESRLDGDVVLLQVSTRIKPSRNLYESMWDFWPIISICKARIMNHDFMRDGSSDQLLIFLRATLVQLFLGEKELGVKWHRDDAGKLVFANHAKLATFVDRSEELSTTQILSLFRFALKKDISLSGFDFFGFYKGSILLAMLLGQHWQNEGYDDLSLQKGKSYSATECVRAVVLNLCQSIQKSCDSRASEVQKAQTQQMLEEAGQVITKFIEQHGSIGVKHLVASTPPTKPLSSLRSSILARLEQIHRKHGTMDGMLQDEQLDDMSWLTETTKLEDVVREMYSRSKKNENKLET